MSMDLWSLPTSLEIGGVVWHIETSPRGIVKILRIFNDPNFEEDERAIIAMYFFYRDFDSMDEALYQEAFEKMVEFIDCGIEPEKVSHARVMDWEQDLPVILPSINKVAGRDIRTIPDLHWWTFLGWYMEIGEGTFATIVSIREKKRKNEKLDKWEKEFYQQNRSKIKLKAIRSDDDIAEEERLIALLDGKG